MLMLGFQNPLDKGDDLLMQNDQRQQHGGNDEITNDKQIVKRHC